MTRTARPTLSVIRGSELPDAELWWMYRRELVNFAGAESFELRVVRRPGDATPVLLKTTGIFGAAGTGMPSYGTPNIRIVWTADELSMAPGRYLAELTARFATSKDRKMQFDLVVQPGAEPVAP